MLLRDVGLGAMGRDTHRTHAHIIGIFKVVDRPDAREEQSRECAVLQHFGNRSDPVPVGMGAEAIVEARPLQAIAVRDLDRVDLRTVERLRDRLHMIQLILVADRVHAVAERHVLNIELGRCGIETHAAILSAIFSAVFSAAEVMMSRLPA